MSCFFISFFAHLCKRCGAYKVDDKWYRADVEDELKALNEILAQVDLGHHNWEDVEDKKQDDDCTKIGYQWQKCTECHAYRVSDYDEAWGHDFTLTDDKSAAPTCTENGHKYLICSHTGCSEKKDEVVPALGHHNAAGEELTTSCTNANVKDRVCVHCNKTIEIKGHDEDRISYTVASTCKTYAYTMTICPACGDVECNEDKDGGYGEHVWGEWTQTKAPTTTEKGEESRKCTVCGNTETRDVDMLPEIAAPAIKATFAVKNANAPEGYENDFTDSSLIALDVKLSAVEETAGLWAFALNVLYDKEDVKFESFKSVSELLYSNLQVVDVNDKEQAYVRVYANANGNEDVVIGDAEIIVTLYFRVNNKEATTTDFSFDEIEATTFGGKKVECGAEAISIKIMPLMDIDANGRVDINDILAVYKMIAELSEETYSVAADLDKNGEVNVIDFVELIEYFSEKISYEHVYNYGWNTVTEETK